ncbi:MAG: TetR/AcrR family transcriptional regulator [Bacteroidetes bacterium]|nr:TetR/AcrR family transcriptional regulator [Bacteroidota bacterium]MBS1608748.1 TetR/AcrR family transcriptional regulator [Bacteroidota bacterium]
MDQQERIVQKAHEMFMRYGIRSISMDEIASQLGISKKTIYHFFTDKDALVDAVINIELNESMNDCYDYREKSENPVHEIFIAIDMALEMLKVMNPTLLFDLQKYHPAAFKKISDHKNKFLYKMVRENLEKGMEEGYYRPEINTDIMARYRIAAIFLSFNPELLPPGKHSAADVIKETSMNFLHGLVTAKGLKLIQKYTQQREKQLYHNESR